MFEALGDSYLDLHQTGKSIDAFTQAIAIQPGRIYYQKRARAYELAGKAELAIKDLDNAIKLQPDRWHLYLERAKLKQKLGRIQEAMADCNILINHRGSDMTGAYGERAAIYRQLGQSDLAQRDLRKAHEAGLREEEKW